jgi:hypothetical protein
MSSTSRRRQSGGQVRATRTLVACSASRHQNCPQCRYQNMLCLREDYPTGWRTMTVRTVL